MDKIMCSGSGVVCVLLPLFITLCWVAVWRFSFKIDKELDNDTVATHRSLPVHKKIRIYTNIVLFSLFLFYTFSYLDIFFIYNLNPEINRFLSWNNIQEIYVTSRDVTLDNQFVYVYLMMIFIGVVGALLARKSLGFMTTKEVLYSLNDKSSYVTSGIFKYIKHPMYVSIIFITLGTYGIFPTILGSICILVAYLFILAKISFEE